jgi:membrane-bound serine protease (ClpP class)
MEWIHTSLMTNILYLLLVVGLWLVSIAIVSPGTGLYEILAGLFLVSAGIGLALVPINYWAVGLLLAGLACFTFALVRKKESLWLAAAGVLISTGSVFLFRLEDKITAVNPVLAVLASMSTVWFYWFAVRHIIGLQAAGSVLDPDHLLHQIAEARTDLEPMGTVYVNGELWTAVSESGKISTGENVEIVGREGLILQVRAVDA